MTPAYIRMQEIGNLWSYSDARDWKPVEPVSNVEEKKEIGSFHPNERLPTMCILKLRHLQQILLNSYAYWTVYHVTS